MSNEVRSAPCSACPYRCDAPSGLWAAEEYDKLPPYDEVTGNQPFGAFSCHATPESLCHGWAAVHSRRGYEFDLLALRILGIDPDSIPEWSGELFESGTEAAEHGRARIDNPSDEAMETADRLKRKYPRLR